MPFDSSNWKLKKNPERIPKILTEYNRVTVTKSSNKTSKQINDFQVDLRVDFSQSFFFIDKNGT